MGSQKSQTRLTFTSNTKTNATWDYLSSVSALVKKEEGYQHGRVPWLPGSTIVKNPPTYARGTGDQCSNPVSGKSSGAGNSNSFKHSCLRKPWADEPGGLQLWGCKEAEMTKQQQQQQQQPWVTKYWLNTYCASTVYCDPHSQRLWHS